MLDGARQPIEQVHRFLRPVVVAQCFGLGERHLVARVAGLLGRFVGGERFGVFIEREVGFAQIEVGERAAVAVGERFDRGAVATQQIQAHAEPARWWRGCGWVALRARPLLREARGSCVALTDRADDLHDLVRPEAAR